MPPDGYHSVSVPDEVMEQLALAMAEYDCDSWAEAIETAANIALERDKAELAQILANQLYRRTERLIGVRRSVPDKIYQSLCPTVYQIDRLYQAAVGHLQ